MFEALDHVRSVTLRYTIDKHIHLFELAAVSRYSSRTGQADPVLLPGAALLQISQASIRRYDASGCFAGCAAIKASSFMHSSKIFITVG